MRLIRLKKYIDEIYNRYGDMEVEVNNISNSLEFVLSSLCVNTDIYNEAEEGKTLLIEVEEKELKYTPIFRAYEYPSNNDINLAH